jgi:CBS domain containing-hemolysin-like protein
VSGLALGLGVLLVGLAGTLRFGGSSLVRTPRADALRDAAEGVRGASRVADLLEETARVQPSLGAVHSAVLVASAIPAAWSLSVWASGWRLALALLGLGVVLVFLGDMLPRSLGRSRPRGPAYRLSWLLTVAVDVGRRTADLLADDEPLDASADQDGFEAEEMELISSVLEFTDAIVREVMVPRTDMITVAASDDTDHALDVILEHGRSRIPVTGDDLDDIVGVLYARDLLTLYDSGEGPKSVTKLMRRVHFVPETKRVSELLRELQATKVHLAVVVNEFGSTAGLVTIEDLLEEIVGEIVDEYDDELPMVEAVAGGVFVVDARLSVDELGHVVGRDLPNGDWDTVGGLVLALAGRVPEEGESFDVEGLTVTVERVQGRRVAQVRVTTT